MMLGAFIGLLSPGLFVNLDECLNVALHWTKKNFQWAEETATMKNKMKTKQNWTEEETKEETKNDFSVEFWASVILTHDWQLIENFKSENCLFQTEPFWSSRFFLNFVSCQIQPRFQKKIIPF